MKRYLLLLIFSFYSSVSNSALIDRGNGLIYDTELDITWLSDANYSMTSGFDSDGRMQWIDAFNWARNLEYSGFTNWRLPQSIEPDPTCSDPDAHPANGFNCTGSEMGHLYYQELGGTGGTLLSSSHNSSYDLFTNFGNYYYWSSTGTGYGSSNNKYAFGFETSNESGWQFTLNEGNYLYALAVHDGDIGSQVVPLPTAFWLFLSGLIGLLTTKGLTPRLKDPIKQ